MPRYGLSSSAVLTRLTVSENVTYKAMDPPLGRALALRVHRTDYHTSQEILSERAWIDALVVAGDVPTALPVRLDDGGELAVIDVDGAPRLVSAFAFLDGQEPAANAQLAQRFVDLGSLTAKLHRQASNWAMPKVFVRKRWDFEAMFGPAAFWGDWRVAVPADQDIEIVEQALARCAAAVKDYGTGPGRFGLIHADLRLANLLDNGKRLAVIDFDDCGFGWFAYDFAAAISFHEADPHVPTWQAAWLEGYRRQRDFSTQDEAILPTMIVMRRLLLTAWLASRASSDTAALFGDGFAANSVQLARGYLEEAG